MSSGADATIVVTTKDRRDELAELLPTALAQRARPQVLIIDDGSSDGTADMVRARFPGVRLDRCDRSLGLIAQRNRAAELVETPLIVSVDDDALLPSPEIVGQVLADFDHPRVAAVAMPYVDVRRGPEVRQAAPDTTGRWVTDTFIGTAHAIRRDVFLRAGGYRADLERGVEEPELCLRLLDAGYVVRLGRSDVLHHLESPKRATARNVRLISRNTLRQAWWDVPMPYLPVRVLKALVMGMVTGRRIDQPRAAFDGLADGLRDAPRDLRGRRPVSRRTYRVNHELRKRGPLLLEEIEDRLTSLGRSGP
jgi:glycosyltransferase involved in cell wall biosynthesis